MIKLTDVYYNSPIFLQNVVCSLEGLRIKRNRYGDSFFEKLGEAETRATWSEKEIEAYRNQRLQEYMLHCVNTIPFYRNYFAENKIDVREIQTLNDLQILPIIDRHVVKENRDQLLSTAVLPKERVAYSTSGTSGNHLQFYTTRQALDEYWAVVWRFRRAHDIQMDTWSGYFSGAKSVVKLSQKKPPFWRYNYPAKQIRFSGFHMTAANLGNYLEELKRHQITYLQGYPSWLSLLAAYVLETGQKLNGIRWVATNSESLLDHQINLIEKAFGVRPIQRYGMAEAIAGISECLHGNYHVDEDLAAVEFIPNQEGPGYRVVGTAFTNLAFGFVRYDIGDVVTLSDERCTCGHWGRLVKKIDGRKENYVVLKDGRHIARLTRIFDGTDHIREAQIIQKQDGFILLCIVKGKNYSEWDEQIVLESAHNLFKNNADYRIEYVEKIQRSKSGKLRLVVSEFNSTQYDTLPQKIAL